VLRCSCRSRPVFAGQAPGKSIHGSAEYPAGMPSALFAPVQSRRTSPESNTGDIFRRRVLVKSQFGKRTLNITPILITKRLQSRTSIRLPLYSQYPHGMHISINPSSPPFMRGGIEKALKNVPPFVKGGKGGISMLNGAAPGITIR